MSEPKPWLMDEAGSEARRHAPATLRNRDAIADVLKAWLPDDGTVLEIASGSGEHIVHFAGVFPGVTWQPSDCEPAAMQSIAAWTAQADHTNILPPLLIDVEQDGWPIEKADALLCINMLHISPWSASTALFRNAERLLPPSAPLCLYGPFVRHDVMTAGSNLAFDASLKQRNPAWGLRDVADVDALASGHGFARAALIEMPANNLSLIYRRC
jgi:cyclopropane fatty-acyl-phospholipid synthase-like methyltransferase